MVALLAMLFEDLVGVVLCGMTKFSQTKQTKSQDFKIVDQNNLYFILSTNLVFEKKKLRLIIIWIKAKLTYCLPS